ncbi:hypothetical protein [uncultured Roseibium sp.]|uniref:hypothetical protein n=1 Tax=uncultured Roseibium sp. TaxID=1936171 RepID=UPI00262B7963|nr:hypothetical protein [uncultured Roseibium sp.]
MKQEDIFKAIDLQPEDPFVWFQGPPIPEEIPGGWVGINKQKLGRIIEKRPPNYPNMMPLLKQMIRGLVFRPQADGGCMPVNELAKRVGRNRQTVTRNAKTLTKLHAVYPIDRNGRYAIYENLAIAILPGNFQPWVAEPRHGWTPDTIDE